MITLREYQIRMVSDTRDAFRSSRRVLLQSPTGSGKTRVMAHILRRAQEKAQRALVLTHRHEILAQIDRALTEAGVTSAMTSTIQSAAKRLDTMPEPTFIVVDEAHHVPGATFSRVMARFPKAFVLGLTATPCRLDGKGLDSHFDMMVKGPSVKRLMAEGFLKTPRYFCPAQMVDVSGLRKTGGDFNKGDLESLMAKPSVTGNAVAEYRQRANGRTALAFCCTVAHAEAVAKQFNDSGIAAASVDGKMDQDERNDRFSKLSSGTIKVLTSCELLSEGYDSPSVGCVIGLRPTASLGLYLQQIGRGLRPSHEPDVVVLDMAGNVLRHGLAEEDREWSLAGAPARPEQTSAIEVRRCASCYACYQGDACPQCGATSTPTPREIAQREGELREITEANLKREKEDGLRSCKTLEDLKKHAKKHDYDARWAYLKFKKSWRSVVRVAAQ